MPQVEIYTKSDCPHCVQAKRLLNARDIAYREIDVQFNADAMTEMVSRSARRTVPQVFVNGAHIGGNDDLQIADRNGDLAEHLTATTNPVA